MMDFDIVEFENRTQRAQRLMHEQRLDALFLMSEPEVRYFTGFRTLFWQSPTRPWFVIVPAKGKPIAVVPEIGAPLMRQTWLDDIRTWSSPHKSDDGLSLLKSVLQNYSRLGVMMGRESQLRMPLADYLRLRDDLPGVAFLDASPLIAALRLVKSEAEISIISDMCTIACEAFDQAPSLFHPGQTLEAAFGAFKIELLKRGAEEVPYLVGGKGPLGYADVISPPGQDEIQTGDVLMLDTGASLKGYFCDFDRNFSFGPAQEQVSRTHDTLWRATQAGLEIARPGVTCAEIFAAMRKVIGPDAGNVGRLGHGLGLQLTETPSLIDWDHTVLPEGAVITLEPSMGTEDGFMLVHEENIVIRDGAPQMLTRRAPREMQQI